MAAKLLIVSGDDLGLLPEIDRGLARAADQGLLTSVSLLANGPAFAEGVAFCRQRPGIGVGAHLALVEGRALVSREEGGLGRGPERLLPRDYRDFLRRWVLGRIGPRRVEVELRCQLERLLEAGVRPDHLDGHQHLNLFPPVARVVARLGREFGIRAVRLPQRAPRSRAFPPGGAGRPKVRLVAWAARRCDSLYREDFIRPGLLLGAGASGRLTLREMVRGLEAFAAGPARTAELVCHPGDGESANLRSRLQAAGYRSPWRFHWREELELLCSPEARRLVEELGMTLGTYRSME